MVDEKNNQEVNSEAEAKPEAKPQAKKEFPEFNVGDTVKVYVKIKEADEKFRLQPFEGMVISRRGKGMSESFTVRKISYGEGVERVFPLYSPAVDKIEVLRHGKVKKAKLYYLRAKKGKAYKVEDQTT